MTQLTYASPIGILHLTAHAGRLMGLRIAGPQESSEPRQAPPMSDGNEPTQLVLDVAKRQLDAYFAGRLKQFDLPLAMQGTEFQLRVWSQLARIPSGKTVTDRQLTWAVTGRPTATLATIQAVADANAANPLAIIVPSHRVIDESGSVCGLADSDATYKRLLHLERAGVPRIVAAVG